MIFIQLKIKRFKKSMWKTTVIKLLKIEFIKKMKLYSCIHDFILMMYLFEQKNNFILLLSNYNNEMPITQVCIKTVRKIDRTIFPII